MRSLILSFLFVAFSVLSYGQAFELCTDAEMGPTPLVLTPSVSTTLTIDPTWTTNVDAYTPPNFVGPYTVAYWSFTVDAGGYYNINIETPLVGQVLGDLSVALSDNSLGSACPIDAPMSEIYSGIPPLVGAPDNATCTFFTMGTIYTIAVAVANGNEGDVVISIADATGATNEDCAGAAMLPVGMSVGDNSCSDGLVWYSYTVVNGGSVSVSVSDPMTTTSISPVITQTNTLGCGSPDEGVTSWTCLPPGTVVYFEAGDNTAPIEQGDFEINITDDATGLPNELCTDVTPIATPTCVTTTLTDVTNNTTVGACQELLDFGGCMTFNTEETVWFAFTTDATAETVDIEVTNGSISGATFVLIDGSVGCPSGTTTLGGCQTGALTGQMISPNTTYYVAVATSPGGTNGTFTLTVTPEDPPANDDCAMGAVDITIGTMNPADMGVDGTTSCATADANDFCPIASEDHVVYYEYTVDPSILTNRDVIITITGDATNMNAATSLFFGLFEDCVGTTYMNPAFSGDACDALLGAVTYKCVEPGTVLTIAVGSVDGGEGDFTITITEDASMLAINDACADATALSMGMACLPTVETVPNNGGCPEVDDLSTTCLFSSDKTVWHTITLPAGADEIEFTALGTDVQLALFENTCAPLTLLGGDCFTTDETFTGLTPGGTYLLAASLAGAIEGDMTFTWTPIIPITNDDCDVMANPALMNGIAVDGTTGCADSDLDFCTIGIDGHDVFYTYTNNTGANTNITITINGNTTTTGTATTDVSVGVYEDCLTTMYSPDVCNTLGTAFTIECVQNLQQLVFIIGSPDGSEGDFDITLTENNTGIAANDLCSGAIALAMGTTCEPTVESVTNEDACPEATDLGVAACDLTTDAVAWYSLTMPAGATELDFSALGANVQLSLFDNVCPNPTVITSVGGSTCITGDDEFTGLVAGNTYLVAVSLAAQAEGMIDFTWTPGIVVANDDCDAMTNPELTDATPVDGTTACADGEFDFCGVLGASSHGVFYTYTNNTGANVDLDITVNTSTATTGIAISGLEIAILSDCLGTLYQPLDCDAALAAPYDVDCIPPGDQIIIYVVSDDGAEGDFTITVSEDTTQPTDDNDNCADALSIDPLILSTCEFFVISGSTADACPEDFNEGTCTYSEDATVWYSFTTPTTTNPLTVEIQSIIGQSGAYVTIYTDNCTAPTVIGGCDTGAGPFGPYTVNSNTTYLIAVGDGAEGAHSFEIQINELPVNDDPCMAEAVMGTTGDMNITVSGTTICATTDYVEPTCGADNENTVWYEYTVPTDATGFEITLVGTGGVAASSVAVGAYSTTACGGGSPTLLDANVGVECDTESNPVSFQCLTPGTTVFVYVGTSEMNAGTFDITFDPLVPDATCIDNDLCADADVAAFAALVTDGGQVCIDDCNAGACPESFMSGACDYSMWPTVFYSVTTDALAIDATMSVSLAGINGTVADPIFSIYTSCAAGAVDPASECIESGTLTGLDIMPNTTYIIAVALEDAAGGEFQLCVTVSTTCNDDPCTPFEVTPGMSPMECTTTVGATSEVFVYDDGGCPDATTSEATVYFTYIPSEGVSEATITFTNDATNGISGDMIITALELDVANCDTEQTTILGQDCGPAGGIMPIVITCPTFNEPILIQVGSTTAGAGEFDIVVDETSTPILNDICSSPETAAFAAGLECEWMDAQANSLGACPESFDFSPQCGFDDFPVVWFEATAPAGASGLDIRVIGAAAGTPFVGVFEGNPVDCNAVINDDLFGCQTGTFADLDAIGQALIDVMPGDVILIGIGTDDPSGSATIDFSIKWNVPPVNDECDMAIELLDNMPEDGSTACATQENPFFASAACDVVNQENTVWYEVTIPAGSKGFTITATSTAMNGFVNPMNVVLFETDSPACDISGNSFVDDVCIDSGVLDETFECVGEGTYIIRLSTSGANEGDFQVVVDILDLDQPNDNCSDPIVFDPVLECEWMDITANTVDACPESFDFAPECGMDDFPVVWFEATAPAGATNLDIRVVAAGSSTPFIAAFEGNPASCDLPDIVNLTNCISGTFDDLVMAGEPLLDVMPGDVILFAVWTDDPAGTTIDFSIKFIVAPPNDECENAVVLADGISTMGTTTCATPEDPLQISTVCTPEDQENTVWYEFTVPDGINGFDMTVTAAATDGLMGNINIVVFESMATGCVADNTTFEDAACATSGMIVEDFLCIGPGTYVIRISTSELNEGDFDIIINEYTSPVVNDMCSNPIIIDIEPECEWYPVDANTVDACPEQFDFASDCGFDDFPVVWYEINVANDDATEIQINLISSATGNGFYSVFNGNPVDCEDLTGESISGFCENTLGQNTVEIDIEANGPQTYLIGIGSDAADGSASIQFEIKVIVPPANDDPCEPEVVTTAGDVNTTVMGTTTCATMDVDDFVCDLQDENSVWYEYTIPMGTTGFIVTLTESGVGQDFAVGVYDFPNGCMMNPVFLDPEIQTECALEDGGEMKFTCLEENTTAFIMVSTLDAEAGDFELIIDPIVPDPLCIDNDLCDMADDGSPISTPVTDGGQVCVSDCNLEACPWDFNAGDCLFTDFPTVFYTVTTDADAEDATMSVILSSADGNPIFSIIEFDCAAPAAVTPESFCVEGDGAAANLSNMEVDANTTYIIVVALDEIDEEGGDFELCVNVTTSCNDDPCSPYPLVDGDGVGTIALDCDNNIGATEEPFDYVSDDCDDPLLFASTVYFSYTVPDNISSFTLFYTNDPVNGILNAVGINIMVYDAANCAFEQVEVVDQQCIQPGNVEPMEVDCPTSGDTYLIQITSAEGDEGEFDIVITETVQDDPCAANDDCDFAMVLDVTETCEWLEFPDCNIQACPEEFFDPGMMCAFDASAVVWYTFTTPDNASSAGIELVPGTVTDPTWGLFIDNGCAVPPTALNADVLCVTTGGGASAIEEDIAIEENTTYYIAVGSETDIEGDFTLNIRIDVPPENDDPCINDDNPPLDLTGGGSHNGTTCCARGPKDANPDGSAADFENAECSPATEDASVWYMFTPNEDDDGYNILLEPGDIEGPTSLEVYTGLPDGGCTGALTLIESSCNSNSADIKIGNCLTPGEVLFVKVTSDDPDENCGTFILSINPASCGPMSDDCIDTADEDPIMPITNPTFTLDYVCVEGCLDYACPEDDAQGGCGEFLEGPTVWYQVTTDEIAAQMFTTVEANGNWTPVWSIWSGTSCDDLAIVNFGGAPPCSNGDNTPELHQVGVFTDVPNYWIAITATDIPDEGIDDGSFELCVATTISAIICLGEEIGDCDDPSLVMEITDREIEDQPLEGPFCQGEEVTLNISFFYDASESGADWLIGFVPIFGDGWDLEGFDYVANAPVGNGMVAEWYEEGSATAPLIQEPNPILCTFVNADGALTLCNQICDPCEDCPESGLSEGDPLPSGYFWVTNGSNAGCDNDGSPGEGWGIGSVTSQIDWTFTLRVKEFDNFDDCFENKDLSVSFQTFSDGVAGCWEDPDSECILDRAMFSPAWEIECGAPPDVEGPDEEICHDGTTNILVQTEDGSTTLVEVEVEDNPFVTGENNYTFPNGAGTIQDDLLNLSGQIQIVIYNVYSVDETLPCPGSVNQIEVTVYPELVATFPPVYVCQGDCIDITPDIVGGFGVPHTYNWSTGESTPSINVCPVVPTTYFVTIEDDLGCMDVAEVEVDVAPPVELLLPESIDVCKDDNFNSLNPDYIVCLDILSGSAPFGFNWVAPAGLVGNSAGVFGECFIINEVSSSEFAGDMGSYVLTVTAIDFFGCEGQTDMIVNITGELNIILDVFDLECGDTDATINVTGFDAVGNPVTTFLLYGGCPADGLGDFLEEINPASGVGNFPPVSLLDYTCYTIVAQTESGCQSTQDITIPLTEGTPIDITGTPAVCIGEQATITITNASDYTTFVWTPDIGNSGSVTFTPDSTFTYFVEAEDATGCKSQSVFTVEVNEPPVISIAGTTTFCEGGTASVTASGGVTYDWTSTIAGFPTTGPTISVGEPGTVTLLMTDANGCSSTETITFTQENVITISLGDANICDGMGDTIFVSNDFIDIVWEDSTPSIVSDTNFYVITGAGSFTVTAIDATTGCDAMGSFEVMDFMTPIINVSDTVNVCRVDSGIDSLCVNFNNQVTGSTGVWTQDTPIPGFTVDLSDLSNVCFEGAQTGCYDFTFTTNSAQTPPCADVSETMTVCVQACPCPSPATQPIDPICNIGTTNLELAEVTSDPGTWSVESGPAGQDLAGILTGKVFNAGGLMAGDYVVRFTLDNPGAPPACEQFSEQTITVFEEPSINTMDGIMCNIDGQSDPTVLDLYTLLVGIDAVDGGTWIQVGGEAVTITGGSTIMSTGLPFYPETLTFEYTSEVEPGSPCPPAVVTVEILIRDCNCPFVDVLPDTLCNNGDLIDLNTLLVNPDNLAGTWSTSGNLVGASMFDPSDLPSGLYSITYTLAVSPGPTCDLEYTDEILIRRQSIATPRPQDPPCSADTGNGPTTSNLYNWLEPGYSSGTWTQTGGSPSLTFTDNGLDMAVVDFDGQPIGSMFEFTFSTDSALEPCTDIDAVVTITVVDCNCPPIMILPADTICNDAGMLDLCALTVGSAPGTFTVMSIGGTDFSDNITDGCIFDATGLAPIDYVITYTLDQTVTGICEQSVLDTFNVVPYLTAEIIEPPIVCNDPTGSGILSLNFTTLVTNAGSGTWEDVDGAGVDISTLPAQQSVSFEGVPAGTYTFTYTIDNADPCPNLTLTMEVIVQSECNCKPILPGNPTDECNTDGPIDLTQYDDANNPGTWSSDVLTIENGNSLIIDGVAAGDYTLIYTIDTLVEDCDTFATVMILIGEPANAGTPTAPYTLCEGDIEVVNLLDLLDGEDDEGVWNETSITSSGGFDAVAGTLTTDNVVAGTYTFEYSFDNIEPCPEVMETVTIIVNPNPIADAGDEKFIDCENTTAILGGPNTSVGPEFEYNWIYTETGDEAGTSVTFEAANSGTYELTVINTETGCQATSTVDVVKSDELPEMIVTEMNITCFGADDGGVTLSGQTGGLEPYMYSLNGGALTSDPNSFGTLPAGDYTVSIIDANGCEQEYEFMITEPAEVTVEAGDPIVVGELGETFELSILPFDSTIITSIVWTIFETTDTICNGIDCGTITVTPEENTSYYVEVMDANGCTAFDNVQIQLNQIVDVVFPNIISPNGDNINDRFFVKSKHVESVISMKIFDRWGEKLFDAENFPPRDPEYGWDGKFNERKVVPGVYVFTVEILFVNGERETFNGDVTVTDSE